MKLSSFPALRVAALLGVANAVLASVALAGAPWIQPDQDSPALTRAHTAYLAGDLKAMGTSVKGVLSDDAIDPVAKENALKLMSKAFDDHCGSMPADWHKPDGVLSIKFNHIRKQQSDGVFYKVSLSGNMLQADTLAGLRLRHYPDEVILDSKAGVGEWEVKADDSTFSYGLDGKNDRGTPMADGLYFIDFELKDGSTTTGWFVFSDLTSSDSPNLLAPANGEHLTTATPTFRWEDFRSPEYKPCEGRTVAIGAALVTDQNWLDAWQYWVRDPVATSATVGQTEDTTGKTVLPNGRYWASLTFSEERTFGDLRLRRGSRTARNFYVDAITGK